MGRERGGMVVVVVLAGFGNAFDVLGLLHMAWGCLLVLPDGNRMLPAHACMYLLSLHLFFQKITVVTLHHLSCTHWGHTSTYVTGVVEDTRPDEGKLLVRPDMMADQVVELELSEVQKLFKVRWGQGVGARTERILVVVWLWDTQCGDGGAVAIHTFYTVLNFPAPAPAPSSTSLTFTLCDRLCLHSLPHSSPPPLCFSFPLRP